MRVVERALLRALDAADIWDFHIELRLSQSSALNEDLNWVGVRQVARMARCARYTHLRGSSPVRRGDSSLPEVRVAKPF